MTHMSEEWTEGVPTESDEVSVEEETPTAPYGFEDGTILAPSSLSSTLAEQEVEEETVEQIEAEPSNLSRLKSTSEFINQSIDTQDVVVAESGLTIEEVEEENDTDSSALPKSPEEIKRAMTQLTIENLIGFQFLDGNQQGIDTRTFGEMHVDRIPIDEIHITQHRTRTQLGDIEGLCESIKKYGVLTPVLVTKHGEKYVLVHGIRRLEALKRLGQTEVIVLVDTTIPPELVKYYEVISNQNKSYTFTEQLFYGTFFKETQPSTGYDTIENALNMGAGEFLKALYIQYHREQYPQIYDAVESGRMTIAQGMKKLEKDIEKATKEETSGIDDLNSGALDDQLRNKDELALSEPNVDAGKQSVSDRKILDPILRRSVESRDEGMCQCCGFGKDEPDFMGVFQVHHIVPVMYGGSDNKGNLILLCNNCHKLVHDYERGQFLPEQETYNGHRFVRNVVILGNMLQQLRKLAFTELKRSHIDVFRMVNRGKLGLGKGIAKAKLDLEGETLFGESPLQKFKDVSYKVAFPQSPEAQDELGRLNTYEEETDVEEGDEE